MLPSVGICATPYLSDIVSLLLFQRFLFSDLTFAARSVGFFDQNGPDCTEIYTEGFISTRTRSTDAFTTRLDSISDR